MKLFQISEKSKEAPAKIICVGTESESSASVSLIGMVGTSVLEAVNVIQSHQVLPPRFLA